MGDDANAVDAEQRHPAVFFVVHFFLDRAKRVLRQEGARHAHLAFHQLVLEPLENRVGDRFAGFQNDVADKTVAHHDLDRIARKDAWPSMLPRKLSPLCLSILKTSLVRSLALHIFVADRHQADRRILVTEHVPGIDRAHDGVLQRCAARAGRYSRPHRSETKIVRFDGHDGGDAGPIDAGQAFAA